MFGKSWFNPKEFIVDNIVRKFGEGIMGKASEKTVQTLKASASGRGTVDELLSLAACQIAHEELEVTKQQIMKIARVFKKLNREKRNKITNIIGHDEQLVAEEVTTKDVKGGKIVTEKAPQKKNMRGAFIISMLAGMSEKEMLDFLEGFGALDTLSENVEEMIRSLAHIFKKFDKEFKIGKKIRKYLTRPLLDWLDENDLEKAIKKRKGGYGKRGLLNFWSSPADLSRKKKQILF